MLAKRSKLGSTVNNTETMKRFSKEKGDMINH